MKPRIVLFTLILAPLVFAQDPVKTRRKAPTAAVAPVEVTKGTVRKTLKLKGAFVPAEAAEIKLDFKSYRGDLKLVEVRPHGTRVNEGDIIARIDTKGVERQMVTDRMALDAAELDYNQAKETQRMKDETTKARLEGVKVAYDRAQTKLEGFLKHEKEAKKENERLSLQGRQDSLENQHDELVQLEKMYSEDELVDATEEIVLKRSRRRYARSKSYFELSERRRIYRKKFYEPWQEEDLRKSVESARRSFDHTTRSVEMGKAKIKLAWAKRDYTLKRQREKFADLKKDRDNFVIRAPRAGLLLHGKADGPWGSHKKGGSLRNKAVFATVANPASLKIKTAVAEKDILSVKNGMAVESKPTANKDLKLVGRLRVDYLANKGSFAGEVSLDATNRTLRPGMTCKLTAILAEVRDVVVVPVSAVKEKDGNKVVMACATKDGDFAERVVSVGISDGKHVEIKDGLAAGEFVR